MISYFIAFYASRTVNWGMAAALSILLLAATLALCAVYGRLVGFERVQDGMSFIALPPTATSGERFADVGPARVRRARAASSWWRRSWRSCRCRSAPARSCTIRCRGSACAGTQEFLHLAVLAAVGVEQRVRRHRSRRCSRHCSARSRRSACGARSSSASAWCWRSSSRRWWCRRSSWRSASISPSRPLGLTNSLPRPDPGAHGAGGAVRGDHRAGDALGLRPHARCAPRRASAPAARRRSAA